MTATTPNPTEEGAASAAPFSFLADDELDALIREKWERTKSDLRLAETAAGSALKHAIETGELLEEKKRRLPHGEWLVWLKDFFSGHQTTASDYMRLARNQVSSLDFPSINKALASLNRGRPPEPKEPEQPKPKAPTREYSDSVIGGKPGISHDPAVIGWVRGRYADGWTRERIVAASAAGSDGWPLPGEKLTNGGVSECRAVIVALERAEAGIETADGERIIRRVPVNITGDKADRLYRLMMNIGKQVRELEHMVIPDDVGLTDQEQDYLAWLYDDLVILSRWTGHALEMTLACMDDMHEQQTLAKLRTMIKEAPTEGERENARTLLAKREARREGAMSLKRGA